MIIIISCGVITDTSERRAEYRTPPPNLKWPIIKVEQKNKIFFLGKAAVQEIAQTSFVPHLYYSTGR